MPKRFHVQLTTDQDAALAQIAREKGLSKASLVRWVILRLLNAQGPKAAVRDVADSHPSATGSPKE